MRIGLLLLAVVTLVGCSAGVGDGDDEDVDSTESALSPGVYVALGDSYSSGVGARDYYDAGCKRSHQAYAWKVASARGYQLEHVACSGARIPDVRANQLRALSNATNFVTISIGGNDSGFASVVTQCAKPWPTTCWGDIDNAKRFIREQLPTQLGDLYREIRARAPRAKVVVVGYPNLFNGEQCGGAVRISSEEQARLNEVGDVLSSTIATAASRAGFEYRDPRNAFRGHAICDDVEWLNGLSNPIAESFHPDVAGYVGYANLILQ